MSCSCKSAIHEDCSPDEGSDSPDGVIIGAYPGGVQWLLTSLMSRLMLNVDEIDEASVSPGERKRLVHIYILIL